MKNWVPVLLIVSIISTAYVLGQNNQQPPCCCPHTKGILKELQILNEKFSGDLELPPIKQLKDPGPLKPFEPFVPPPIKGWGKPK